MVYYAHSLADAPPEKWETMEEHETAVAELCSKFLKRIHADLEPWGELLGRWHDIGKYSDKFQSYILQANDLDASAETKAGRVDHSSAGAQHSSKVLPKGIGDLIAYVIAGHHAGLADRISGSGQKSSGLNDRIKKRIENWENAPKKLVAAPNLTIPLEILCYESQERCGFQLALLCRLLFSALCDADYLATEQFLSPDLAHL